MKRVLMVCLGNICRSPLAEGIFRSKINDFTGWVIDSAGTAGYHIGDSPDRRAIKVARDRGIDISQLQGRKFDPTDFDKFDVIFVMDHSNFNDIRSQARSQKDEEKIKMILDIGDFEEDIVPDPYYGNLSDFMKVYHMLDKACDLWIKALS